MGFRRQGAKSVKRLVDIQTVADALGVKVSTVYAMVSRREGPFAKDGRLHCVRVGRSVRLRESDVEAMARIGYHPEKQERAK